MVHAVAGVHLLSNSGFRSLCRSRADAPDVLSASCWGKILISRTRKGNAPGAKRQWLRGNMDWAVVLNVQGEIKN